MRHRRSRPASSGGRGSNESRIANWRALRGLVGWPWLTRHSAPTEEPMSWSYRITNVAGIPIRVHVTFFLILLLGAYQWHGIPVREIVLLPLGGVAQMTKHPERPAHELLIALAGPLVNVLIAALLLLP